MTEDNKTEQTPAFDATAFLEQLRLCTYESDGIRLLQNAAHAGHIQSEFLLELALCTLAKKRTRAFTIYDIQRWARRCGFVLNEEEADALFSRVNSPSATLNAYYVSLPGGEGFGYIPAPLQNITSSKPVTNTPAFDVDTPWNIGRKQIIFPPSFQTDAHEDKTLTLNLPNDTYALYLKAFIDIENLRRGYTFDTTQENALVMTLYDLSAHKIEKTPLQFLLRNNLYFEACKETIAKGIAAFTHIAAPSWVQTSLLQDAPFLPSGQAPQHYKETFHPETGLCFARLLNNHLRALRRVLAPGHLGKDSVFLTTVYACGYVCFLADLFTPQVYLGTAFLKEHLASLTSYITMPGSLQIPDLLAESYEAFANIAAPTHTANTDPILFLLSYTKLLVKLAGQDPTSVHKWLPVLAVSVNIFNTCNEVLHKHSLLPL